MKKNELNDAIRRARNILQDWCETTGAIEVGTSYYYELQGVVDDAVHCGAQGETKNFSQLESEKL
jgi:hypothetical protein